MNTSLIARLTAAMLLPVSLHAQTAQPTPQPARAPFTFASFTWLNGNSRQDSSVLDTKYFTGEFRADFDPHVMAMAIRVAINAVPAQLARDPALDIGHYAREIADLFHLATRPGQAPRESSASQQSPED